MMNGSQNISSLLSVALLSWNAWRSVRGSHCTFDNGDLCTHYRYLKVSIHRFCLNAYWIQDIDIMVTCSIFIVILYTIFKVKPWITYLLNIHVIFHQTMCKMVGSSFNGNLCVLLARELWRSKS